MHEYVGAEKEHSEPLSTRERARRSTRVEPRSHGREGHAMTHRRHPAIPWLSFWAA